MTDTATTHATVRRAMVRRIIQQQVVGDQDELVHLLAEAGHPATQSTVSRDLRALRAHKVRLMDGRTRYVLEGRPAERASDDPEPAQRLRRLSRELVLSHERAKNLLVLHSPVGAAGFLAASIDDMHLDGVMGTIAGDDTVLLIATTTAAAQNVERALRG